MEEIGIAAALRPKTRRSKAGRFDQVSITLHWLTVLLVIAQFTTASWFGLGDRNAALLLMLHRSTGLLTLAVVLARLGWRHTFAHLPPFPEALPKPQKLAAQTVEWCLYVMLVVQPLTGLGDTLFGGHHLVIFGIEVPIAIPKDKPIAHVLHMVHETCAWVLLGLIGTHASAALFHGVIARDGVLERMLPWTARDK